jgi:hypothetical protein
MGMFEVRRELVMMSNLLEDRPYQVKLPMENVSRAIAQAMIYNVYMGTNLTKDALDTSFDERRMSISFPRENITRHIKKFQEMRESLRNGGNVTTLVELKTFCPEITLSKIRSFNDARLTIKNYRMMDLLFEFNTSNSQIMEQRIREFKIAVNDLCPELYNNDEENQTNRQIVKMLKDKKDPILTILAPVVGCTLLVFIGLININPRILMPPSANSRIVWNLIEGAVSRLAILAGVALLSNGFLGGRDILIEDILRDDYKGINGSSEVFDVAAYKLAEMFPVSEKNKEMVAMFTTTNEIIGIGFASELIVSGTVFLLKSPKLIKSTLVIAICTCCVYFGHYL